jgi:gamma-glutamyltranspeptidase/glutathione hydrolase
MDKFFTKYVNSSILYSGSKHHMATSSNLWFFCTLICLNISVFILSGCQNENKLILSNQPNIANNTKNKTQDAKASPEPATEKQKLAENFPTKTYNNKSTESEKYMVAAANPLAAKAGLAMLKMGGSAVDAAIATQLALNVVEPQSSGIGGGAFLLHYQSSSRLIEAYDGREKAPAAATGDMFLKPDGSRPNFYDVVPGGLSVGVPGALRMFELAHKKHGKLSWSKLFGPAIKLAEEGFNISPRLHYLIKIDRFLKTFKVSREFFYTRDGYAKPVGTRLVNKPLANTFRKIATGGSAAFYTGPIAAEIISTIRSAKTNPGRMKLKDLAAYRAVKRAPVCLFYRKWLVCGMPPPTSGGVTTLQILGLLQGTNLSILTPGSSAAIHLITEASRLAFADRSKYLADEDFVEVPKSKLIDPGYLAKRAQLISVEKSMGRARPGIIKRKSAKNLGLYKSYEGESTSHISIVDSDRNAVSMTSSIENAFGSRLMVRGFLLNNQLTDFSFLPTSEGKPIANRVEPNKRPRSSMSPMLVVDNNAKLVMVIGSPGGSRIIGYVAKTIIAALDWKKGIQAAINMPHFVNRNGATELEQGTVLASKKTSLENLGHKIVLRKLTSGLHGIMVGRDGMLSGGADPRREGVAIGD